MKVSTQHVYDINIKAWAEIIEDLSNKYSRHSYLESFDTLDIKNEFLRYPDNQNFEKLIHKKSNLDLQELENDCNEVFKIASSIIFAFSKNFN